MVYMLVSTLCIHRPLIITSSCFRKLEMFDKFGKYDSNRDGLISVQEAHKVLQEELGLTEERSRSLVAKFDFNKDGAVSYVEFAEFYLAVEEK